MATRGAGWLVGSLGSGAVCVLLAALLVVSNKSRDFEHAARRCDSWQAHKQLTHNVISENVFQGPRSPRKRSAQREKSRFLSRTPSSFSIRPVPHFYTSLVFFSSYTQFSALKLAVMFLRMACAFWSTSWFPLSPRLIYGGQKYCLHNNSIASQLTGIICPERKKRQAAIALSYNRRPIWRAAERTWPRKYIMTPLFLLLSRQWQRALSVIMVAVFWGALRVAEMHSPRELLVKIAT